MLVSSIHEKRRKSSSSFVLVCCLICSDCSMCRIMPIVEVARGCKALCRYYLTDFNVSPLFATPIVWCTPSARKLRPWKRCRRFTKPGIFPFSQRVCVDLIHGRPFCSEHVIHWTLTRNQAIASRIGIEIEILSALGEVYIHPDHNGAKYLVPSTRSLGSIASDQVTGTSICDCVVYTCRHNSLFV